MSNRSESAKELLLLAESAFKNKLYENAITLAKRAKWKELSKEQITDVKRIQALSYYQLGKLKKAYKKLSEVDSTLILTSPFYLKMLCNLEILLAAREKCHKSELFLSFARTHSQLILLIDQEDQTALEYMAELELIDKNWKYAENLYSQLIDKFGNKFTFYLGRSKARLRQLKFQESFKDILEAWSLNAESVEAYWLKIKLQVYFGLWEETIAEMELMKSNPNSEDKRIDPELIKVMTLWSSAVKYTDNFRPKVYILMEYSERFETMIYQIKDIHGINSCYRFMDHFLKKIHSENEAEIETMCNVLKFESANFLSIEYNSNTTQEATTTKVNKNKNKRDRNNYSEMQSEISSHFQNFMHSLETLSKNFRFLTMQSNISLLADISYKIKHLRREYSRKIFTLKLITYFYKIINSLLTILAIIGVVDGIIDVVFGRNIIDIAMPIYLDKLIHPFLSLIISAFWFILLQDLLKQNVNGIIKGKEKILLGKLVTIFRHETNIFINELATFVEVKTQIPIPHENMGCEKLIKLGISNDKRDNIRVLAFNIAADKRDYHTIKKYENKLVELMEINTSPIDLSLATARLLSIVKNPCSIPMLKELLKSTESTQRIRAIECLKDIGKDECLMILENYAMQETEDYQWIATALSAWQSTTSAYALLNIIKKKISDNESLPINAYMQVFLNDRNEQPICELLEFLFHSDIKLLHILDCIPKIIKLQLPSINEKVHVYLKESNRYDMLVDSIYQGESFYFLFELASDNNIQFDRRLYTLLKIAHCRELKIEDLAFELWDREHKLGNWTHSQLEHFIDIFSAIGSPKAVKLLSNLYCNPEVSDFVIGSVVVALARIGSEGIQVLYSFTQQQDLDSLKSIVASIALIGSSVFTKEMDTELKQFLLSDSTKKMDREIAFNSLYKYYSDCITKSESQNAAMLIENILYNIKNNTHIPEEIRIIASKQIELINYSKKVKEEYQNILDDNRRFLSTIGSVE